MAAPRAQRKPLQHAAATGNLGFMPCSVAAQRHTVLDHDERLWLQTRGRRSVPGGKELFAGTESRGLTVPQGEKYDHATATYYLLTNSELRERLLNKVGSW